MFAPLDKQIDQILNIIDPNATICKICLRRFNFKLSSSVIYLYWNKIPSDNDICIYCIFSHEEKYIRFPHVEYKKLVESVYYDVYDLILNTNRTRYNLLLKRKSDERG